MTTRQKMLLITTVILAVAAVVYETLRAARLEMELRGLPQEEALSSQIEQLRRERDQAQANGEAVQRQVEQLRENTTDLFKLRGEVAALRKDARELAQVKSTNARPSLAVADSALEPSMKALAARVDLLKQKLEQTPGQHIPELQWIDEDDWFKAARTAKTETEADLLKSLGRLRTAAKEKVIPVMTTALQSFTKANDGQLPTDLAQLKPYFDQPVDDAILERYILRQTGDSKKLKPGVPVVAEKERLSPYDSIFIFGPYGYGHNYKGSQE